MKKIIELIATGSGTNYESLEKAKRLIESFGFVPRASPTIFGEHPLYSHTDQHRLQNLIEALYAEDSEIIWCLRGGSGTTRLLPHLEKREPPQKPKMVIGLSDVTALLLFLSQRWGWQVVHGYPAGYVDKLMPEALEALIQLIQHKTKELSYGGLIPLNSLAKEKGVIQGLLTGGNMSLIQYSVGTPWEIKTEDRIFFFEDINEEAYRIAERLEHLKQAGKFKAVKAILFGDFLHQEKEKYRPDLIDFVLKDFANGIEVPCFSNLPVGHRDFCRPLVVNLEATLTTGPQGMLLQRLTEL